jgi:NAD-dependent deacetylase
MERVKRLLAESKRVVALTGAGISAESGVPTFRGPDGLWRNYRPEEIACMEAFLRDPVLVWEWYLERKKGIRLVEPNKAHHLLSRWEADRREADRGGFTLITQNVDGLHGRAGSRNILELHGNIWTTRCLACERQAHDASLAYPALPPKCPCGGTVRPHIVWFGEMLDPEVLEAAWDAVGRADLCFVIGTSSLVYPAAALPRAALEAGAAVVEVNPEPTPFSDAATVSLRMKAVEFAEAMG